MNDLDDRSRSIARLLEQEAAGINVRSGSLEQVRRRATQRRQRRVAGVSVLGVAASVGGLVILSTRDGARTVRPADAATSSTDDYNGIASTSTQASSVDPNRVTTIPLQPGATVLAKGSTGSDVVRVQDRLRQLGFDPGPSDGVFGTETEQAVWAFEGMVMGRAWAQQSGTIDQRSMDALFEPGLVFAPRRNSVGEHTEIYLDLQVLIVFHADSPVLITHISSGSGESWCERVTMEIDDGGGLLADAVTKDVCGVANTPGGVFQFYRGIDGHLQTPLGEMYNPVFFNYGIAVAGAQNVPREPTSHGAVRVPMAIAEYFPSLVENGDGVFVWDGMKEPEQQSAKDMLPVFNFPNPDATTTTPQAAG